MPRLLLLSNARSGSTYLKELMSSHPECVIQDELLNKEEGIHGDVLLHLENSLAKQPQRFVGFKVFPEQILERGLCFDKLVKQLRIKYVLVLWRESMLEMATSLIIAHKNHIWYSSQPASTTTRIAVKPEYVSELSDRFQTEWKVISEQWPKEIHAIFLKFEDLIKDPNKWLRFIFSEMYCEVSRDFRFFSFSKRQNPAKLKEKVLNWDELPLQLRELKFDAAEILATKVKASSQVPTDIVEMAPEREPCIPAGGWCYRVADPFMPPLLKQNVFDAISSGSVSSAGFWPRLMSTKLKALFEVPVAQPCSNGFMALMLAMQAVHIGKDDEVIMPSMTMVAVANAASFLGAKPVFVDCMKDNYNPGWEQVQNAITNKTKAVIVSHTYGVPNPDLEKITEECKSRGLWFIEDISECIGVKVKVEDGEDKLLGTFGQFACASMYVNKMIHAGDGGFVITKDAKFESRLASLVNHGFTPSYHFVHYERAVNAKINGLGAAMGCACIDEIDKIMEHRMLIADIYRTHLESLPVIQMPNCGAYDTPWVFGIECQSKEERTKLRRFLAQNGIETRDYFFPLHLQPAFQSLHKNANTCETRTMANCEKLGSTGFYLPTHSNLLVGDLYFICSVIRAFYTPDNGTAIRSIQSAPPQKPKLAIQIKPDSFQIQVRSYNSSGYLLRSNHKGHLYIECVRLGIKADQCIRSERWDEINMFLSNVDECIKEAKAEGLPFVEEYFASYLAYFQSLVILERPIYKPWLQINLANEEYIPAQCIPTTTAQETLQLLVWLVQETKPEIIWEIGCWLGHATYLMAAAANAPGYLKKIFACDGFLWQKWMEEYDNSSNTGDSNYFKDRFLKNTEKFHEVVEAVDWPYSIEILPSVLSNNKPNLVLLDMTNEDDELEILWAMLKPNIVPNETIIAFSGLNRTSISFFTRHARELVPYTNPAINTKAFKYIKKDKTTKEENQEPTAGLLDRKVKFSSLPNWDHHHKNLFCESILILHKKLHNDHANVLFVPAVEQEICDEPELLTTQPWIGVIHSVVNYPELYYVPDLERLCNPRFDKVMKNCKGLFTLTKFQARYLKQNLASKYSFPIQPLIYPVPHVPDVKRTSVPDLWKENKSVDLVLIGSFARDFDLFFKEPVPDILRKVLLIGDDKTKRASERAPQNVQTMERLSDDGYEEMLLKSVLFLALKYDGAANTLILECITRNLPIVAPNLECCVEYIGEDYPLLYDSKNPKLLEVITLENIEKAIKYLQEMDKSHFNPAKFVESVEKGAVLLSLHPFLETSNCTQSSVEHIPQLYSKLDITICICSYKRTHHLKKILDSLWNKQDFKGTMQIIVWNNNECRTETVKEVCNFYIQRSTKEKSLELISSTENHYCTVRFVMPPLMKSDCLLICDDDMIPNDNFVTFFLSAGEKYPNDILCLHGHKFFPHNLNVENPVATWRDYENLRFYDDAAPEQLIHFVHADACLIPKRALEEVASMKMPDASFALVDDYWMSFVLNHHFGRRLRKLSTGNAVKQPVTQTFDSNTVGLALHTRPEVQDARIRLYIHHMLQGWPSWKEQHAPPEIDLQTVKHQKFKIWDSSFIGMNITSIINEKGIDDLVKLGVSCVRIGAVGLGRIDPEFNGFLSHIDDAEKQLRSLANTVELLSARDISTVITLQYSVASTNIWKMIAKQFAHNPFVVGYDLMNEPFTPDEETHNWIEIGTTEDSGTDKILTQYVDLITAIRDVDRMTPIVIESSFWAHSEALKKLPLEKLLTKEPNLITSFHFYEPSLLTHRRRNQNRYRFPGEVPVYENACYSEQIYWDPELIHTKLRCAMEWAQRYSVKIFVGEFGICREIPGADKYLKAIMDACKDLGLIGFLFSFRDTDWDAMDYELGSDLDDMLPTPNWDEGIMKIVVDGIKCFSVNPEC